MKNSFTVKMHDLSVYPNKLTKFLVLGICFILSLLFLTVLMTVQPIYSHILLTLVYGVTQKQPFS